MKANVGYSGRSLAAKLGVKPETRLLAVNAPAHYESLLAPSTYESQARFSSRTTMVHAFASRVGEVARIFDAYAAKLPDEGVLWVSWPKKSSGVQTDVTGQLVRETGLAAGLVDVKVCAVDETWSALKFVRRLRDRGKRR